MDDRWKSHQSLLASVSRSFFLSVKWLPRGMREPVALGYLIARLSDTIADDPGASAQRRLEGLAILKQQLDNPELPIDLSDFAPGHEGERELIETTSVIFQWLSEVEGDNRDAIRKVASIIIDGQSWDLEHFHTGKDPAPVSHDDLLHYTYSVAGCVGEFWTEIGFLNLGEGFANPADRHSLMTWGLHLGQGLQLINIIRDLHEDLPRGRQYLPSFAESPGESFEHWLRQCRDYLEEGHLYAEKVRNRRARFATALPLLLAESTASELEKAGVDRVSRTRIKVGKKDVWKAMAGALTI